MARWYRRVEGRCSLQVSFIPLFCYKSASCLDPPVLELHRDSNDHLKSPESSAASPRRSRRDAKSLFIILWEGWEKPLSTPAQAPPPPAPMLRGWVFSSTPGQEKTFKGQGEQCPLLPPRPMAGAAAHPQQREVLVVQGVLGGKTALKYLSWCELAKPNNSEATAK